MGKENLHKIAKEYVYLSVIAGNYLAIIIVGILLLSLKQFIWLIVTSFVMSCVLSIIAAAFYIATKRPRE